VFKFFKSFFLCDYTFFRELPNEATLIQFSKQNKFFNISDYKNLESKNKSLEFSIDKYESISSMFSNIVEQIQLLSGPDKLNKDLYIYFYVSSNKDIKLLNEILKKSNMFTIHRLMIRIPSDYSLKLKLNELVDSYSLRRSKEFFFDKKNKIYSTK